MTAVWGAPDVPDPDVTGQPAQPTRTTRPIGTLRHGKRVVDGDRPGTVRRRWVCHWRWLVEWADGTCAAVSIDGRIGLDQRMLREVVSA